MHITCQQATALDLEFLYHVKQRAYHTYALQAYGGWNERFQRAYLQQHLAQTQIIYLGDQPIGWQAIAEQGDHLELVDLHLLPEYQHQGIGSQLIKQVIARAEQQQIAVRLEVLKVNPARRLYERLGFRVIGETTTHFIMSSAAVLAPYYCPRDVSNL